MDTNDRCDGKAVLCIEDTRILLRSRSTIAERAATGPPRTIVSCLEVRMDLAEDNTHKMSSLLPDVVPSSDLAHERLIRQREALHAIGRQLRAVADSFSVSRKSLTHRNLKTSQTSHNHIIVQSATYVYSHSVLWREIARATLTVSGLLSQLWDVWEMCW